MDYTEFQRKYIELLNEIRENDNDPEAMQALHTIKAEAYVVLHRIREYNELLMPKSKKDELKH